MPGPQACGFALISMNRPQLWVNSAAALLKERLRESTLTENYLVLPGQVLQPEAKGGVTLTENIES